MLFRLLGYVDANEIIRNYHDNQEKEDNFPKFHISQRATLCFLPCWASLWWVEQELIAILSEQDCPYHQVWKQLEMFQGDCNVLFDEIDGLNIFNTQPLYYLDY